VSGPLIIKGFGFNQFHTILFNIPFSAFQVILTLISAAISQRIKLKWPVLFFLCLPPIAGGSALFVLGRGSELRNKLLACYYVVRATHLSEFEKLSFHLQCQLSFFTAIQPMLYTWSSQNTAGHTKKLCTTAIVFVAQCAGNIVGPLLYRTEDAPDYHPGLLSNLVCWIVLAVLTLVTAAYLRVLNARHAALRRAAGKSEPATDESLEDARVAAERRRARGHEIANAHAFDDLTDCQNEDFMYAL
jgi:hypothetical protein